jgi:hypothetical protein
MTFNNFSGDLEYKIQKILKRQIIHDESICLICYKIAENPIKLVCCKNKYCCSECIEEWYKYNINDVCFHCTKKLEISHETEKKFFSYSCKCLNNVCKWKGELHERNDHLKMNCISKHQIKDKFVFVKDKNNYKLDKIMFMIMLFVFFIYIMNSIYIKSFNKLPHGNFTYINCPSEFYSGMICENIEISSTCSSRFVVGYLPNNFSDKGTIIVDTQYYHYRINSFFSHGYKILQIKYSSDNIDNISCQAKNIALLYKSFLMDHSKNNNFTCNSNSFVR